MGPGQVTFVPALGTESNSLIAYIILVTIFQYLERIKFDLIKKMLMDTLSPLYDLSLFLSLTHFRRTCVVRRITIKSNEIQVLRFQHRD